MAKKKATDVVQWEDQMAKDANVAAAMEEGVGGGSFFSLKGGILSFMDNPMPGNEMVVVIIDSILENVYYEDAYDPDVPQSPACFAFGRIAKEMEPHKICVEAETAVSDACEGCPNNEFGSADVGKGKACGNTRRLAMIPAGSINKDGDIEFITAIKHFDTIPEAFMKLPGMSVKGFAGFVTKVTNTLKRPPYGIYTKVSVVPDPKSQFRVIFEPLEMLPDNLIPSIIKRNEEMKSVIDFPYQVVGDDEEPEKKKPAKKKATKKKASKRKY